MMKPLDPAGALRFAPGRSAVWRFCWALGLALSCLFGTDSLAGGAPVLTVTPGGSGSVPVELDLAQLDALATQSFETTTPWTVGRHTFTGPSLDAVLRATGAEGTVARLVALNGYSVDIPLREVTAQVPVLATRIDGKRLSVRDMGPVWLVYPYDLAPDFHTEVVFARSIWQLRDIDLRKD